MHVIWIISGSTGGNEINEDTITVTSGRIIQSYGGFDIDGESNVKRENDTGKGRTSGSDNRIESKKG